MEQVRVMLREGMPLGFGEYYKWWSDNTDVIVEGVKQNPVHFGNILYKAYSKMPNLDDECLKPRPDYSELEFNLDNAIVAVVEENQEYTWQLYDKIVEQELVSIDTSRLYQPIKQ